MTEGFLDQDLQRRFRQIEVFVRERVNDLFSGDFMSHFKGSGMEFEDVREYMAGDDVRSMDWNITARTGTPHIRQFMDRRELSLYFLIDVSASTFFGSGDLKKRDELIRLFALLGSAASHKQNNVGMIAFSDRIEGVRKAVKGMRNVLRIAHDLLELEPRGQGTSIKLALDELMHMRKGRCVVILLSDLWANDYHESLQMIHHLHDFISIRFLDKREQNLPSSGAFVINDLEKGSEISIDCSSKEQRAEVENGFVSSKDKKNRLFQNLGMDYLDLVSDEDLVSNLQHFFAQRKDRIANGR
jgi:uncharacterized protein (DUF58 family)